MRFKAVFLTKRSILELFLVLFFSFLLFCYDFGGIPTKTWLALNIFPISAGFFSWLLFQTIVYFLNINKVKYWWFILINIPICLLLLFLLKKI